MPLCYKTRSVTHKGGFDSDHWIIKGNSVETNNQGWKSSSQKGTEGSALTVTSYVCFELGKDFIRGSKLWMVSLTNQMLSLRDMATELLEGDQKHDTALPKRQFITLLTSLQMCIVNICELKQNKFTSF